MTRYAKTPSNKRGFTLIELVVVISVIAILAALLIPTILGQADKARVSRAASEVNAIGKALVRLRTDTAVTGSAAAYSSCLLISNLLAVPATGTCPPTATAFPSCNTVAAGTPCWGGPYLAATPTNDPWNRAYIITTDASGRIQVASAGADGTPNNSDDTALIKSF